MPIENCFVKLYCWVRDQNKNNCCRMTSWMRESVSECVTNKFIEDLSSYIKSWILIKIKNSTFIFYIIYAKKYFSFFIYDGYYESIYTFWSWSLHASFPYSILFHLGRTQPSLWKMNEFSNVKEKLKRKKTQYICKWV